MVAILIRLYTFSDIEKVEDIVQDTFVKALANWRINGLPDNPEGWLMQVAKNRAIDYFRSNRNKRTEPLESYSGTSSIAIDNLFTDNEISDAQLRMVFACCHPLLSKADQIAITLQIVSGFGIREIASALLKPFEQVKKRIQRAKTKLRDQNVNLNIPQGDELIKRRATVLSIIYLVFNEGYASSINDQLIRKDLCWEALRLGKLICDHKVTYHPDASALVGLMCFHAARIDSRLNKDGGIILLEDQDRSKWNMPLIHVGNRYMFQAVETDTYSKYHYEAAILSEYLKVNNVKETNWDKILKWYDHLEKITPSPYLNLNKAIIAIYQNDLELARILLDHINIDSLGNRGHLVLLAEAKYFEQNNEYKSAIDCLLGALNLSPAKAVKELIEKRITELNEVKK